MQLVSPAPGSLASARTHLVAAQGFAANVSNSPTTRPTEYILEGIKAAKLAASELFLAQPRSDFQDLVAARQQVLAGAKALEAAFKVQTTQFGAQQPAQVKALAGEAFDAFENAFEIIDND